MPFKSEAQRRLFHVMADKGEISKATVHHWEAVTPKNKPLPMHVEHPKSQEKHSAFYGHGVAQAMLDVGMVKMNEDKIPGGLADNKTPADFATDALAQGRKVEREHTSDTNIANEIAMDHLTEDKNYYTKLKKMEKESIAKAAAFLKQAWPWSRGGQGVSTIEQNYHPATVQRAKDIEAGRAPSVARPNLPPQTMGADGVPRNFVPNTPQKTTPPSVPAPVPGRDPLQGATGERRNALALNAQNWR